MGFLSWIVFGLIAGLVAKWIMPGKDPGGLIITILIGVATAFLGRFIGSLLGFGGLSGFDLRSLATAIVGAALSRDGLASLPRPKVRANVAVLPESLFSSLDQPHAFTEMMDRPTNSVPENAR